jgi:hypothetical protein
MAIDDEQPPSIGEDAKLAGYVVAHAVWWCSAGD